MAEHEDGHEDGYDDDGPEQDPRYYPTEQAYPGMEGMEQMGQEPWAMGPMSEPGWATRKLGPLPVWAWLLVAGGVSFGGYVYYQNRQKREEEETKKKEERRGRRKPTRANKGRSDKGGAADDDSSKSDLPALPADTKGWYPSRTTMTNKLESWLKKNKQGDGVTIFSDADEAVKHVKAPSPLITLKLEKNAKFDEKALEKSTRREGLYPVRNGDVVGLYPTENTKRGKMWETYIDDLRDEGQAV